MPSKIVIIGAGSMAFAPTLVSTFISDPFYRGSEIALVDIFEENLMIMHNLMLKLDKEMELDIKFTAHTDRRTALPGADIVVVCIAVGGNDAFLLDLEIPTKYGFVQPDGESLGPGGISRGLRHIPVMVDIAKDVAELCPQARMYNYTNPMALLTQAVYKYTDAKCTGLCIGAEITKLFALEFLDEEDENVSFLAAGLNHFHFLLSLRKNGVDLYPKLREKSAKFFEGKTFTQVADELNEMAKQKPENASHFHEMSLCLQMLNKMGYFPGPGDGHIGEFYPQWFVSTEEQRKRHAMDQVYIRKVLKAYPGFYDKIKGMSDGTIPFDKEMFKVGKTWEESQLNDIEIAMRNNTSEIFHINIPNHGYIADIPENTVVEIPVMINANGYNPIGVGRLPKEIVPCIVRQAYNMDLMIEAAMEGDRRKVMAAFANDPNCFDLEIGQKCIDELLEAQKQYLPRFFS